MTAEWKVRYWRYHVQQFEEADSLDEALSFCVAGVEYGTRAAEAIIAPDGRVIEGDAFTGIVDAYEDHRLDEWLDACWPELATQLRLAKVEEVAKASAARAELAQGLAEFKAATGVDLTPFSTTGLGVMLNGYDLRQVVRKMTNRTLLR